MGTISKRINVVADSRLYADVSFSFSEASTDIASNTSTINWSVSAAQVGGSVIYFSGTNRTGACAILCYINGTCVCNHAFGLLRYDDNNKWSTSGSIKVPHNTDGNKTISVSLQINRGGGNYSGDPWTYGSASGSSTMKLSFIARASSISCPSLTLGTAATIKITRASSAFTEIIKYSFGSAAEEVTPGTDGTSVSWTPPLSLASQIPKATSGTMTLTCDTYYSGKCIGSKSIQVKVSIPASVKPTLSSLGATVVNPSEISSWGIYVQSKSKAKLTINGAAGVYGSTITGYTIKGGGFQGNAVSFETGVLNSSDDIIFTATVTDSRGRTSDSKTVKISVVPYSVPAISKYSSLRCVAAGTESDEGTCVLGNVTFSYSTCSGKNTIITSVAYRKQGVTSWTDAKKTFESAKAFVFGDALISAESTYEIQYSIKDAFGTVSVVDLISTAAVLMDFKAGGTGIAVGKVSEKDSAFEVNPKWNIYFHGQEIEELIKSMMSSQFKLVANHIYPVGSIYISISATNPGSLFGGTWVQVSQGRFLLGQSSSYAVKSTGGEAAHKLTIDEMPKHHHEQVVTANANGSALRNDYNADQKGGIYDQGVTTWDTGGDKAHNNMPPYYVAYMWERTA